MEVYHLRSIFNASSSKGVLNRALFLAKRLRYSGAFSKNKSITSVCLKVFLCPEDNTYR